MCAYTCKSNSAYVCIYLQEWPLLCVYKHARSIALLPAYKCIYNQAYVCIYVRASLHLSVHIHAGHGRAYVCIYAVHIHAGTVAPMCTYMRRPNSIHECYTCNNNSAHMHIYAWVIAHMCAYTCRHGPMRAYICRQDSAYVCTNFETCTIEPICAFFTCGMITR